MTSEDTAIDISEDISYFIPRKISGEFLGKPLLGKEAEMTYAVENLCYFELETVCLYRKCLHDL